MNKNRPLLFSLVALLLAALACARTGRTPAQNPLAPAGSQPPASAPSTPAQNSSSLPAGQITRTLSHDGLERSYILYVPASVDWSKPVPLVFVFHGGTGNAQSAVRMSGFNEIADQHGFLVAYPNGTSRLSSDIDLTWNGGTCCGFAQQKNIDDVGFVRSILADVQSLATVDSHRVYATGLSNGAILSQRLACEAADIFAAIAPVSGTLNFQPCNPSRPIPVIEFHGTGDEHIQYNGGAGPKSLVDVNFVSVPDTINFWVTFDQCSPQPQTESFADVQHDTYAGCAQDASVELFTIVNGGHAWPGGKGGWPGSDEPTQTISASQLMWEFFAAHPMP